MRKRAGGLLACGLFFLGLLAPLPAHAHPAKVDDFPLTAPLTGSDYGMPARVVLPREILSRTAWSLRDVRIFDDLGQETAFLVDVSGSSAQESISWEVQGSQTIGEDLVFLLGRGGDTGAAADLTILSGQAWACSDIEVFTSTDSLLWQPLTTGRIANLESRLDARWMSIRLPETHAPFLKVVLRRMKREGGVNPFGCLDRRGRETDLSDPPPFTRIQGFVSRISKGGAIDPAYDEESVVRFDRSLDSRGNTVIDLAGMNLPVKEVALSVGQGCFYREAFILAGGHEEGSAFGIKASGGICSIPGLGFSRTALMADIGNAPRIRIRIMNNGEPPLDLNRISLRWPRACLIFVPQKGRRYSLCFGAGELPSGPAGQAVMPGDEAKALWKTGAPVLNESYRPGRSGADDIRWFFIFGAVILFIYCIGFWAIQVRNITTSK
jgi:hypothetical protein